MDYVKEVSEGYEFDLMMETSLTGTKVDDEEPEPIGATGE